MKKAPFHSQETPVSAASHVASGWALGRGGRPCRTVFPVGVGACLIVAALCGLCRSASVAEGDYLSPTALVADGEGKTLYVACETAGCVAKFDLASEKVTARYAVEQVRGVARSPDSSSLYATGGGPDGKLVELDASNGEVVRRIDAGHTPLAPAVSPDGKTVYFCNRFSRADQNDVHAVDTATGKIVHSAKAIREPVSLRLSKDGSTLWVANHLPLMVANSAKVYASVSVFNSATLEKIATLDLPPGSFAARDCVMSSDGRFFFVVHTIGRFTVPTTHLDRGWINTSAVSIFDVSKLAYVNTVLLDDTMRGAANPWGVAITPDDAWLCVTASGTHELIAIHVPEMMNRLAAVKNPQEVMNDLGFLYGAKTRVRLEGEGARALTMVGNTAFCVMRFTDSLNGVEIWDDGPGGAVPYPLGETKAPNLVRKGEMAFNDATCCYQQWQSCASCHPDTRSDGVNWDLMNDGIGNPKQSRSLLYTHKTSPVMITGIRASAEIAVAKGFTHIQFHEVDQARLDAVNAYLKTLEPVPSPYLRRDGSLTEAAQRGKRIFDGKAACIKCHTPPYFGDKQKHVLGLGTDSERDREFATPILIEVWRTAPYMYDGRAVTIRDVVTTDNTNNRHGNTRDLTPQEADDLAEYVNSL